MPIVTIEQAAADLVKNIRMRRNTIIVGAVGVGKTDIARQAAATMASLTGKPWTVIDKRASQMAPTDLTLPFPDPATGKIKTFVPDWLPDVARDGEHGILLFDEFSDAPVAVQAGLNQITLEGELASGAWRLPEGWTVVLTGNRISDRAAAGKVSRASANRLAVIHVQPDAKAWLSWAITSGIDPSIIAYVQQAVMEGRGDSVIHKYPAGNSGDAEAFPTPRSIAAINPFVQDTSLGDDELRRLISYNVGDDWTEGFMAFLRTYRLLPDLNDIIANPTTAKIHHESTVNYALAVGLSSRMDLNNVAAIATYAKRMNPEYAAAMWDTAVKRTDRIDDAGLTMGQAILGTREHVEHMVAMRNAGL